MKRNVKTSHAIVTLTSKYKTNTSKQWTMYRLSN